MSFRHDAMYLVEPLPPLADRLRTFGDNDLAEILLEPRLFRQQEGGNSEWLQADREVQAKLLFLASLTEYTPLHEPAGFEAVFDCTDLSAAVFDRWYRVRRFVIDQELELLAQRLHICRLEVHSTGRPLVDQWLSRLLSRAEPDATL